MSATCFGTHCKITQIFNSICAFSWKIKDVIAVRRCMEWTTSRWSGMFLSVTTRCVGNGACNDEIKYDHKFVIREVERKR
jgi:hypothetical protein